MRPRARSAGLIVRDLAGEVIVYDLEGHRAHCLNPTAAAVFRRCDGRHSPHDLAAALGEDTGTSPDEDIVRLALEQLRAAGLLEPGRSAGPAAGGSPEDPLRRVALRAGLGAAALLPFVTSLLVPTPAEAANTCIPVEACTGNTLQPCYNVNPATECANYKCKGSGVCSL